MELLIKNGTVVTDSETYKADVGIDNGKITGIFKNSKGIQAEETLDVEGKLVFPGIIDSHVHFQLQDMGKQISDGLFRQLAQQLGKAIMEKTGLRWSSAYKLPVIQQMFYQLLKNVTVALAERR